MLSASSRERWQISLLYYLEDEEEEGEALSPSLEKDGTTLSSSL